jgi:hypothetical protein
VATREGHFLTLGDEGIKLLEKEFIPLADLSIGGVLTARGKVLRPYSDTPCTLKDLQKALNEFRKLPRKEQFARPDEVLSEPNKVALAGRKWASECRYPDPPLGGLILKEYIQFVGRDAKGGLHRTSGAPKVDFLWMTNEEWKSLLPREPRKGQQFPLPSFLLFRIGNHGTYEGVIRQGGGFSRSKSTATVFVEDVFTGAIRMRVVGVLRASGSSPFSQFRQAIEGTYQLGGRMEYDRKQKRFRRFDIGMVGSFDIDPALAKHYGAILRFAPGQTLVHGCWFELVAGDSVVDRVRPLGTGVDKPNLAGYFKPPAWLLEQTK